MAKTVVKVNGVVVDDGVTDTETLKIGVSAHTDEVVRVFVKNISKFLKDFKWLRVGEKENVAGVDVEHIRSNKER